MKVKFLALSTTINVDDSDTCYFYSNSMFIQSQNMKISPLVAPNGSAPFVLTGTTGADTLIGKSNVTNEIFGLDGKDIIMGVGGPGFQNFLFGGNGADVIYGGKSPNTIFGGADNDLIFGGIGNGDKIYGGLGNDVIVTGDGNTFVEAGRGDDTVILGNGTNTIAHNVSDNLSSKDFYDGEGGMTTLYLGVSQAQYTAITTATLKINNVNLTLPQAFAKYAPTNSGFNLGVYDSKLGFHLDVTAQEIKKLVLNPNPTATNDSPAPLQINPAINSTLTFNVLNNDQDNTFANSGGVTPLAPTALKVSDVSALTISGATLTVKQIDVINPLLGEVAKFDLVKTGAPVGTPHALLTVFSDGTTTLNTNHSFDTLSNFTISFQYTNDDGFGGHGSATALIAINQPAVNHAPVAVADPLVTSTNQNTGIADLAPALLANDSDPDAGAVLSIASVSGDSHIALDGSGHVVFTPGTDFKYLAQGSPTTVNFMYTAKDQLGALSNTVAASITVNGVNDAPLAVADPNVQSTNQNTGIADLAPALLTNDSDPDTGAVLSIASVSGDPHITLDGSGHVVFTPGTDFAYLAQNASTTVNFMYTAKDQFNALSNTVAASITVNGVNDAPLAVADPLVYSTNQNTGIADLAPALLANDSDPDAGAVLSIASVSGDPHISLDGSGHVVFTPNADFKYLAQGSSTTVNFMYTAKDQLGALSNTVAASITVNGVNDTPLLNSPIADQTDATGAPITPITAGTHFSDPDVGDTLSYAAQLVDSGGLLVNGGIMPSWISIDSQTGSLSSVNANPGAGDAGDYYVKVIATDLHNLSVFDIFKIGISAPQPELVLNPNPPTPPLATEYVNYADTAGGKLFDASSLFIDNDPLDPMTFSATGLPTGFSIDPVTGFIYGQASVYGSFNPTITATDGAEQLNTGISLSITEAVDQFLVQKGSTYYALNAGFPVVSDISVSGVNLGTETDQNASFVGLAQVNPLNLIDSFIFSVGSQYFYLDPNFGMVGNVLGSGNFIGNITDNSASLVGFGNFDSSNSLDSAVFKSGQNFYTMPSSFATVHNIAAQGTLIDTVTDSNAIFVGFADVFSTNTDELIFKEGNKFYAVAPGQGTISDLLTQGTKIGEVTDPSAVFVGFGHVDPASSGDQFIYRDGDKYYDLHPFMPIVSEVTTAGHLLGQILDTSFIIGAGHLL